MKLIIVLILVLVPACMPLTQNSALIKDLKKNLEIQSENSILIGKKLDLVSDKLGLNLPPITLELKDALKELRADNDKQFSMMNTQLLEFGKLLLKMGAGAVGIPPAVTNAGMGLVEGLVGGSVAGTAIKHGIDLYATRRREKKHQEELEEAEEEKEKIRLRLEKEKEELRVKALIKQKTMAKVKPEYQIEYDRCKEEAERELKARGEI